LSKAIKKAAVSPNPERKEFGARLAGARIQAGKTQLDVAKWFDINKATVSAWETGLGLPDALRFRSLVKLYKTTADALLWDSAVSYEAMQMAAVYENLSPSKRILLTLLSKSLVEDGVPDAQVEAAFKTLLEKQR
jgi:transcriptional regulator with XRE-family HTH domain